jgi:peptidase E
MLHLLAGGPGSDRAHLVGLLTCALRACGSGGASVAYVGAASGDSPVFQERIAQLLRAAGAGAVISVPSARGACDAPAARRVLAGADVVFVSGGDVEAGMRLLGTAGLVPALRQALARGADFIGLSAGSIMLGRAWLAWSDPDDDASARPFDCLGFAPLVCDTHAEDDGWNELHALLDHLPDGTRGYAIPSRAMLCVNAEGSVTACGDDVSVFVRNGGVSLVEKLSS